ncbi:MAG TPA: hypothetical protein VIY48_01930 [Candidatus Paceibacterota bacterium]
MFRPKNENIQALVDRANHALDKRGGEFRIKAAGGSNHNVVIYKIRPNDPEREIKELKYGSKTVVYNFLFDLLEGIYLVRE